jgi:hypothetical protein
MIGIKQFRLSAAQPRVAQPHRYAQVEPLGFVFKYGR